MTDKQPADLSVLACDTNQLTVVQENSRREFMGELQRQILSVEELENGYKFFFPDGDRLFGELTEWVALEGVCCSFLNLALERSPLTLQITGPDNVKIFLQMELGIKSV